MCDYANDTCLVPCNAPRVEYSLVTVTKTEQERSNRHHVHYTRQRQKGKSRSANVLDVDLHETASGDNTVDFSAAPIEEAYSSADQGYVLRDAEATALRLCRRELAVLGSVGFDVRARSGAVYDVRSEKARSCAMRALERTQEIEGRVVLQQ